MEGTSKAMSKAAVKTATKATAKTAAKATAKTVAKTAAKKAAQAAIKAATATATAEAEAEATAEATAQTTAQATAQAAATLKSKAMEVVRAIDIARAVEKFAPLSTQAEWDNSGFSVGDPQAVVHKVLIALNCTLDVVEEAVEQNCDMILTHHPLIFGGCRSVLYNNVCFVDGNDDYASRASVSASRTSVSASRVSASESSVSASPSKASASASGFSESLQGRSIAMAIKNNITIYSSHTPLDKARGGLNDLMAQRLNLQNCKVLSSDGFGVVGTLRTVGTLKNNSGEKAEKGMNGEEFIKFVKKQFNLKYLRCSKPIGYGVSTGNRIAAAAGKITKVAVSSGSGQRSAEDAIAAGAQALVTADVSHHNFYQPEGFMILDIGHYESEWEAVALLESIVKKNFSKFAVSLSKKDKSPIYHF